MEDTENKEEEFLYKTQLIVISNFGEFLGRSALLSKDQLDAIIEMSKSFYKTPGFELTQEDGNFIVFPGEVIKNSILKINIDKVKVDKK